MDREKRRKGTVDVVYFSCHVKGNHWCLGVFNIGVKRCEIWDSLRLENKRLYANMLGVMRKFVDGLAKGQMGKAGAWADPLVAECPQQSNCDDCGVFTCSFA